MLTRSPRVAMLLAAMLLVTSWAAIAVPVLGQSAPDAQLAELEALVRSLHSLRRSSAADLEKARATAAKGPAEARELTREAEAILDEVAAAKDAFQRLTEEHAALRERKKKLVEGRAALVRVLEPRGEVAPGSAPAEIAKRLKALRGEAAFARALVADDRGEVRVGKLATLPPSSAAGHEIASQLGRKSEPALVRVRLDLAGLEKR